MRRRRFIQSMAAAGPGVVGPQVPDLRGDAGSGPGDASTKPKGRLGRRYRILWDQNHGQESFYNPPLEPEKVAAAHFGYFEGTPVDAYVCALGPDCGYTVSYPTRVAGMEFIVDRYERGAKLGDVRFWRHAENLKHLWSKGIDPLAVQVREARRLGIDFWFRLSMNDWHHADNEGRVVRLIGSRFYAEHPEYRIGKDGAAGWPERTARALQALQDYAVPEVRQFRLDVMAEACERYDVDGFLYDFMRVPGYFRFGHEAEHLPVMTGFIRETRRILDRIGSAKGRVLGLAVRVPNTIAGARRLGLDVPAWVREDLVDLVIPSTFFAADLEEDVREWVEVARGTAVRIHPAIEEGYRAGHTGGVRTLFYDPPVMLPLRHDMIRALAARHWRNGADGLYLFNWFGTAVVYDYDNRSALDDIADPGRLAHKNKRYVVMRTDGSFPNCLPHPRQIPAPVGATPLVVRIAVADDLAAAGTRLEAARLHVHFANLTVVDRVEVRLNGALLECENPMQPGALNPNVTAWQNYAIPPKQVRTGENEVSLRLAQGNARTSAELPVRVEDLELALDYGYPSGDWERPPGFAPRT